jgi:hypothetical protein
MRSTHFWLLAMSLEVQLSQLRDVTFQRLFLQYHRAGHGAIASPQLGAVTQRSICEDRSLASMSCRSLAPWMRIAHSWLLTMALEAILDEFMLV